MLARPSCFWTVFSLLYFARSWLLAIGYPERLRRSTQDVCLPRQRSARGCPASDFGFGRFLVGKAPVGRYRTEPTGLPMLSRLPRAQPSDAGGGPVRGGRRH